MLSKELFYLALHQAPPTLVRKMSNPNSSQLSNIGGATYSVPQIVCDCPCHNNGNTHPCGGMCWHPGTDQYGLPLDYDHASVSQLLKAALVRGVSVQSIESNIWEALFLSASEAATGVHTSVAANDAFDMLKKWLANLLTEGED